MNIIRSQLFSIKKLFSMKKEFVSNIRRIFFGDIVEVSFKDNHRGGVFSSSINRYFDRYIYLKLDFSSTFKFEFRSSLVIIISVYAYSNIISISKEQKYDRYE